MHRFFFTNSRFMEFQVRYLALFHLEWFWIGSLQKDIQSVLEFLKAPLLVLHFFLLYINDPLDDVMCNIAIYVDDTTLYSVSLVIWLVVRARVGFWTWIWPRADILYWDRKWQIVLFGWSNNFGAIDVKINRSRIVFSSNLDWGSFIVFIAKTASKKIGTLFILWGFFLLRLLFISMNMPYEIPWNTAVMSVMVLLAMTLICWISCRNWYVGLLVFHLLPLNEM